MHELQGGKFGHGFLASGVSALAKPAIRGVFGTEAAGKPYRITARAVIGGTISSVTGGKFVNGAVMAAFSQAYNAENTMARENTDETPQQDANSQASHCRCVGEARVMRGNPNHIGTAGGFSGNEEVLVNSNSVAIDPQQWGGKENVRPYLNEIEIRDAGGEVLSTNVAEVIGSSNVPEGYDNIREYLRDVYPSVLLLEFPVSKLAASAWHRSNHRTSERLNTRLEGCH